MLKERGINRSRHDGTDLNILLVKGLHLFTQAFGKASNSKLGSAIRGEIGSRHLTVHRGIVDQDTVVLSVELLESLSSSIDIAQEIRLDHAIENFRRNIFKAS